jgi:hypothetical protein
VNGLLYGCTRRVCNTTGKGASEQELLKAQRDRKTGTLPDISTLAVTMACADWELRTYTMPSGLVELVEPA